MVHPTDSVSGNGSSAINAQDGNSRLCSTFIQVVNKHFSPREFHLHVGLMTPLVSYSNPIFAYCGPNVVF
jgi:hypothetical protein